MLALSKLQAPLRPLARRQFYTASSLRKASPTVLAPNSVSALALKNVNSTYVGTRDYNSQSVEVPEAFYGGVLGKVRNMADMSHENEAGLPSTGREDALIGVTAAQKWAAGEEGIVPSRHIFNEFSLDKRVGFVTGGNSGIGLEMSVALCEAGANIYVIDVAPNPSETFLIAQKYVEALGQKLHYVQGDVTNQQQMWEIGEKIGDAEGRLDVCVAAAGILKASPVLEYPIEEFDRIIQINVNGCFVSAQTAARQMRRFGQSGSIILIASMSGSITNRDENWIAYNSSKSAVVQMARSLACELGKFGIRASTISPGHVRTNLTEKFLQENPGQEEKWSNLNPLGRIGRIHEMRGAVCWLASDASSYVTGSDIYVDAGQHAW